MTDAAKLPAHVIRERARWVRLVERTPGLTQGARRYARKLAYRRWGAGQVAWSRTAAARELQCSTRSIPRWNAELCAAGLLHLAQRGGIWAGRRMLNVFGLLFPQVRKGDRKSPPSSNTPTGARRGSTRRAVRTLADALQTARPHPQTRPDLLIPLF